MSFGNQWGAMPLPVTAVVSAIDSGQQKQIGLSAMQLDNLSLKRQGIIDVSYLQGMVERNKQKLPVDADYPSVTVSANGLTVQVPVYNAFGRLTINDGGVRISEQLATKLKVRVGDTITISS